MTKRAELFGGSKRPQRYCAVARGSVLSANQTPLVSFDFKGENNQVIVDY